jgi:hypothetical protein
MARSFDKEQDVMVRVAMADPLKATLLDMLRLVNDWLKFAEAKNGGVIGLSSAAIAVLLRYIEGTGANGFLIDGLFIVGSGCLVLSVLFGMTSFLPQTDLLRLKSRRRGKPSRSDNLFYFGHLAKYSARHLAEEVTERYVGSKDISVEDVHVALASQIVINARITVWKLRLFSTAGVLFGAGLVICAAGVLAERA